MMRLKKWEIDVNETLDVTLYKYEKRFIEKGDMGSGRQLLKNYLLLFIYLVKSIIDILVSDVFC